MISLSMNHDNRGNDSSLFPPLMHGVKRACCIIRLSSTFQANVIPCWGYNKISNYLSKVCYLFIRPKVLETEESKQTTTDRGSVSSFVPLTVQVSNDDQNYFETKLVKNE